MFNNCFENGNNYGYNSGCGCKKEYNYGYDNCSKQKQCESNWQDCKIWKVCSYEPKCR